ncbi:hypothetical protein, partial [Paramuribaculum intestinale]|uniref:hypothetical protein n=1 Tax=Paramuribaculum intestinale TaxID=2094151 RepID=UPI0025A9B623
NEAFPEVILVFATTGISVCYMCFGATDFRKIGAKNFWHCFWHQFGTKMIFAEKSSEDIFSSASPQISFRLY